MIHIVHDEKDKFVLQYLVYMETFIPWPKSFVGVLKVVLQTNDHLYKKKSVLIILLCVTSVM